MTLTNDQRDLLSRSVSEILSGTFRVSFGELPKLGIALVAAVGQRDHVIQGLKTWLLTDDRAREILMTAVVKAGMKFEELSAEAKKQRDAEAEKE